MSGDWIKMRGNLWDDPRVASLCDATDKPEAMIVGALYWLWAMADQHTEDGVLPGLSTRQIDRKTGVDGFAQALCDIGWLADHPEGVRIVGFEDHNGKSAKRRLLTAQRVAKHKANATLTHPALPERSEAVSRALPREEKRREEKDISKPTASHPPGGGLPAGFAEFWEAWPKNERKQDKAKCAAHWKLHKLEAAPILADVRIKRATEKWMGGFIEAPLVYLRGRRWEDGVTPEAEELKPANQDAERSQAYLREQAEHAASAVPPPPNLRALVRKLTSTAS